MNTTVQKWGNSLALRIPRLVAKDSHLHQGSVVEITLVAGKIVVKPRRERHYTLTQLLRGVTKRNRHAEFDWGGRVGQEAW
ncbi:MAG: AbrB/MazE/SpoVT family DNA-binding domain-containing protein [Candidatus Omnitrophica bacterium]|nr:AbrB/MazE/SpoVT family DNA-binding domain-containing protein [Candidatus Omnitrophota bacterium]